MQDASLHSVLIWGVKISSCFAITNRIFPVWSCSMCFDLISPCYASLHSVLKWGVRISSCFVIANRIFSVWSCSICYDLISPYYASLHSVLICGVKISSCFAITYRIFLQSEIEIQLNHSELNCWKQRGLKNFKNFSFLK